MEAIKPQVIPQEWMRCHIELARSVLDNPGGGLLAATQAIGQVRAALAEQSLSRTPSRQLPELLAQAEEFIVTRQFGPAQELLSQVLQEID
ncbi:MAG: hypothetical protein ACREN8_09915 [Candidatus Dormibacteraceae bacterium]